MNTTIIILISIFILVIILKNIENNNLKSLLKQKINKNNSENIFKNYIAKPKFFTDSEFVFFKILQEENIQNHLLFANVRFEDLLKRKDKAIKGRGYVKSKHIDFVIVDKNSNSILALIEVDGKSHNGYTQKKLDVSKNQIAQSAFGDRFYRIKVGTDFRTQIKNIFLDISTDTE